MPHTELAGWPPIKIAGAWRTAGRGPHDDVEVRVAYSLVHAPALNKFLANVDLTAVWMTIEEGGWRLTLKGVRGTKPVVAYFHERTFKDLFTLAATSFDCNRTKWWPDDRPITLRQ